MEVNDRFENFRIGYIFGLVASILSFMVCFVMGILVFHFDNVIEDILEGLWGKVYLDAMLMEAFPDIGEFAINALDFAQILLYVMAIGFILGLLGTIMSIRKITMFSSLVMIIGGILSLFCLIFPGVFLITGGVLNLKKMFEDSNSREEKFEIRRGI